MATHDNYEHTHTHTLPLCHPFAPSLSAFLSHPYLLLPPHFIPVLLIPSSLLSASLPLAVISARSQPVSGRGGWEAVERERERERGSVDFNDAHEDERRGRRGERRLPQEGIWGFYSSPCTPVYLHSFGHTRHEVTVIEAPADSHIFALLFILLGERRAKQRV